MSTIDVTWLVAAGVLSLVMGIVLGYNLAVLHRSDRNRMVWQVLVVTTNNGTFTMRERFTKAEAETVARRLWMFTPNVVSAHVRRAA